MSKKLDWVDAEELAVAMMALDEETADSDTIEQALADNFDISFEQFHKIAEQLIKFTPVQVSPLTEAKYCGFVDVTGTYFIAKVGA